MTNVNLVLNADMLAKLFDLPTGVRIEGATFDAVDRAVRLELTAHDEDVFGGAGDGDDVSATFTSVEAIPGFVFEAFHPQ